MGRTFRKGAVGALMDEYERAAGEIERVLDGLSDEEYERIRDTATTDEDCRSIQTIMTHVIGAGYGYANMLRTVWEMDQVERPRAPVAREDVVPKLRGALDYMGTTLDGRWELPEPDANAMQMQARWGPVYDFEQLLEHAIVHVMRHRRQIERFLAA